MAVSWTFGTFQWCRGRGCARASRRCRQAPARALRSADRVDRQRSAQSATVRSLRACLSPPRGLARACAVHPKRTLAVWVAAVLVSFVVIALLLGSALTSEGDVTSNPESKQAEALIRESFPPEPAPSEIVVVRSDRYTVDDLLSGRRCRRSASARRRSASSRKRRATTRSEDQSLVSKDRHATMVPLVMRSDEVAPLVDLVKSENGQDGFQVSITGSLTADADFEKLSEEDLQKGELLIGLPAALIMLVLVFGAVVAGLVPVLLGLLVDRDRGCLDRARRPGVRGLVLRREHDLGDGPRARDRLRAVHPLALPGRARARAGEDRRDRGVRGDGEPGRALQRHRVRARDVRDAPGAGHDPAQPRAGRDPRRHRLGARGADAACPPC